MSFYGKQDFLFQLQNSLLQAKDAEQNTTGYAFFRATDDISSPGYGNPTLNMYQMGSRSFGRRNRWNVKNYFRINITVPKGNKELVEKFAESQGLSVNSLINRLLSQELGC